MKLLQRVSFLVLGMLISSVASCKNKPDKETQKQKNTAKSAAHTATENKSAEEPKANSSWKEVAPKRLEPQMHSKFEKAKQAQKKMANRLKKQLKTSVSKKSFPETIEFCKSVAPEIADDVSESMNLDIGRTSHKLRNPENTPPEWATQTVSRRQKKKKILKGPKGQLGYLHPIEMKGLCVNCHGKNNQLADGVPEMLSKHYPRDEATGFKPGDLRGWFWVEIPSNG